MISDKIRQAYERLAPYYNEHIDHKPHNAFYNRPNMLALIGDAKGKTILDAACGPGKYSEILLSMGADVTGFDASPKMIKYAKARNPEAKFFIQDLALPFQTLADRSFDTVLSALAMHYVENWTLTIKEFHRVLKPGGQLVISIEHPFFEYNYFKSRRYFDVEAVKCTWNGFGVPIEMHSYRRSLQECISPLVKNGFVVDNLIEPRPTKEFETVDPRYFKKLNTFPAFMGIRCIRP
ncbi:MAG: class I SAM-dependent methyltransferase [Bacteroidota bacterium]